MRARLVNDGPWPVVIIGPVGTGKTCIAHLCLNHVAGTYTTIRDLHSEYVQASKGELVRGTREMPYTVGLREFWEEWQRKQLAVIDEIGSRQKTSDAETDLMHGMLERRRDRATMFISNRTLDELSFLYGAPIASRLTAGKPICVSGDDRRLKNV